MTGQPGPQAAARVRTAVQAIWHRHRESTLARVALLEEAVAAILQTRLSEADQREAERIAHQLAGSVGTFGFQRASHLAREIEATLVGPGAPARDRLLEAAELVVALRRELEVDGEVAVSEQQAPEASTHPTAPCLAIAVHASATEFALFAEAEVHGYRPVVMDPSTRDLPVAAVIDLGLPEQRGLELLSHLRDREPAVPTLVLSAAGRLGDRVEAARSGARWFLPGDAGPDEVLDAVDGMVERASTDNTTVLAVDDDPAVRAAIRAALSAAGLNVVTTGSAHEFWAELERTGPDLVMLDFDMPDVGGDDLCQVLRGDRRWAGLPILFLTGSTDPATVSTVFSAGADDFVAKPFVGPELLARIVNRLERTRLFKAFADTDALTGLANRRQGEAELEALFRRSKRYGHPLSVAMLDLDHFKRINDEFGHATGDVVLRRLGTLIAASFRGEDVAARWGGEEFLVAMYGIPGADGVKRIEAVLGQLRSEEFRSPGGKPFTVTCSGGVATYPGDAGTVVDLCATADRALYRAKETGRDRMVSAASMADDRTADL